MIWEAGRARVKHPRSVAMMVSGDPPILGYLATQLPTVRWSWCRGQYSDIIAGNIYQYLEFLHSNQEHGTEHSVIVPIFGNSFSSWVPISWKWPKVNICFWQQRRIQFETLIVRTKSIVMHQKSNLQRIFSSTSNDISIYIFSPILSASSELYSIIRL